MCSYLKYCAFTPFAIASHHQEEREPKAYKNNYVNISDKIINSISDPNG